MRIQFPVHDGPRQRFSTTVLVWAAFFLLAGCVQPPSRLVKPDESRSEAVPTIAIVSSDISRLPRGLVEELGATEIDRTQITTQPVDAILVSRDLVVDASRDATLSNDLLDYLNQHRLLLIYKMTHREFFNLLELPAHAYSEALPPYAVIGVVRLEGGGWALGGVASAPALVTGVVTVPEAESSSESTFGSSVTPHQDPDVDARRPEGVATITINGVPPTSHIPDRLINGIHSFVKAETHSIAPGSWCNASEGSMLYRDRLVFSDSGPSGAEFAEVIWLCQTQSHVSAQVIQETKGPRSSGSSSGNLRPVRSLHTLVTVFQPAMITSHHSTNVGVDVCVDMERDACQSNSGNVAIHDTSVPIDNRLEWTFDYRANSAFPAPEESFNTYVSVLGWSVVTSSPTVSFAKETTIDVGGWLAPVYQARATHLFGLAADGVEASAP